MRSTHERREACRLGGAWSLCEVRHSLACWRIRVPEMYGEWKRTRAQAHWRRAARLSPSPAAATPDFFAVAVPQTSDPHPAQPHLTGQPNPSPTPHREVSECPRVPGQVGTTPLGVVRGCGHHKMADPTHRTLATLYVTYWTWTASKGTRTVLALQSSPGGKTSGISPPNARKYAGWPRVFNFNLKVCA